MKVIYPLSSAAWCAGHRSLHHLPSTSPGLGAGGRILLRIPSQKKNPVRAGTRARTAPAACDGPASSIRGGLIMLYNTPVLKGARELTAEKETSASKCRVRAQRLRSPGMLLAPAEHTGAPCAPARSGRDGKAQPRP